MRYWMRKPIGCGAGRNERSRGRQDTFRSANLTGLSTDFAVRPGALAADVFRRHGSVAEAVQRSDADSATAVPAMVGYGSGRARHVCWAALRADPEWLSIPLSTAGGSRSNQRSLYQSHRPARLQRDRLQQPLRPRGRTNPGRGCGEQRVVFARNSGRTPPTPPPPAPPPNLNRLLIIFEALVPNPQPHRGLDGCEDIQKFWLSLSDSNMTPAQRGDRLRDFFLNGIPAQNIRPVIHIDSYSNIGGQIRTNQFLNQGGSNGFEWTLREFKIQNLQPGIRIIPATVKTTPDTSLFSGTAPIDLQPHFAARIADELQNLRGGPGGTESNAATIGLNLSRPGDDAFNPFESSENVADRGSVELAFKPTSLVGVYLAAKLDELKKPGGGGTTLTVDNVIQRIQTQTCAGCHQWSNGKPLGGGAGNWPSSLQFVHQSEQDPETVDGVQRFRISETLKSPGFIPARCRIVADFLSADNSLCTNVQ